MKKRERHVQTTYTPEFSVPDAEVADEHGVLPALLDLDHRRVGVTATGVGF